MLGILEIYSHHDYIYIQHIGLIDHFWYATAHHLKYSFIRAYILNLVCLSCINDDAWHAKYIVKTTFKSLLQNTRCILAVSCQDFMYENVLSFMISWNCDLRSK